jgi:hypothetical protein
MSFITGAQLARLLNDYGPTVAFLTLFVVSITALILMWKPVSKFMTAVNLIIALPKRMDEQDALVAEGQTKVAEMHKDLDTHIKEGAPWITKLDEVEKQVHVVLQQQAEVVHEVKPNSGTSMKDALNRIENEVLPALAKQMSALGAAEKKQSTRVNDRHDAEDEQAAAKPAPRRRALRKPTDSTEEP